MRLTENNGKAPTSFHVRYGLAAAIALAVILIMLLSYLGSGGNGTTALAAPIMTTTGTNVLYTTDAEFDQGTLVNVNHDAPNSNQLQLNTTSGTFPFIWVALSRRCTIAKINTQTGAILGEYRTISDSTGCSESSRTTVAIDGSVWMGHRGPGGVTHVGLAELNQCVDRNSNSIIDTSTGYGDVKPWLGVNAGEAAAQDECIIHHVNTHLAPLNMGDSRHMSIDANNKLWVGDRNGGSKFVRIDGTTGVVETSVFDWGCGGYGGLIDGNGVIWSATSGGSVLRWDPNAPVVSANGSAVGSNPRCIPINNYGMAVDSGGNVWVSELSGSSVRKISPDGVTIQTFPKGPGASGNAQGLAVDGNGDVWISSSLFCSGAGCTITHLKNDGTFVGNVPNPTGGGSTGVSIDANGKIWTANLNANTATRIDPALNGGVGGADLTVNFPATPGRPLPFPYNYSDMTGAQLFSNTAPQGSWTVVQDSGNLGQEWGKITWNSEPQGSLPPGTQIIVEARAADTEAALGSQAYVAVSSGTGFSLTGQFIQVRATLKADPDGVTPVLSDIRIQVGDSDGDGITDGDDNCPTVPNPGQEDQDLDGIGDACDDDVDGDDDPNPDDNCVTTPNPDQADADGDGRGDACDSCPLDAANDADGDGLCADLDNCPLNANADQADADGDGRGDACDSCPLDAANDADGDGICGNQDNCPLNANPGQADADGDGTGDACDSCPLDAANDADGDGICGNVDNCPLTANPDQRDTNLDGVGDLCTPFQYATGGQFVIGDLVSNAGGASVNFWGSQWSQNNPMSGGSAPNAFKGFENGLGLPACGTTWTSQPGNSSSPPLTVPQFMAVIVSSSVQKSGSVITGNVRRIIIVRTNPGYGPSPGHTGTGEVVAILCGAP